MRRLLTVLRRAHRNLGLRRDRLGLGALGIRGVAPARRTLLARGGGLVAAISGLVLIGLPSTAHAQANLFWDANGATAGTGGTGTWNTAGSNWRLNSATGTLGVWNNAAVDNATFGTSFGTVTLGVPITAHNLTFSASGYTLTGSTLTLAGTTPTITATGSININSSIAGVAGLTKTGSGVLILNGANSFSGGITISTGSLHLNGTGALGDPGNSITMAASTLLRNTGATTLTVTGNIALAGAASVNTTFNASVGDMELLGVISGDAGRRVVFTGAAGRTITLGGANTYDSQTGMSAVTVEAGVLANTGVASSFGTGTDSSNGIFVSSNSILSYTGAGASSNRSFIVNQGGIFANNGSGALSLSGIVLLQLGNGTFGGSFGGTNTISSAISGPGNLIVNTAGTWALAGDNVYTGATTITAGTLQLGDGGPSGSILGNVTNNGTLAFNRSNTLDFGGVISGSGAIRQIGPGTTVLTGDSSAFTGTTSVEAGALAVNGSLCGDMNVLAGGRLQGIGTVCDTSNAGIVAPGNSIGTLTVAGNYTGNGGTLQIESVLGGDASPTDRLVVTGNTAGSTNVRVINLGGGGAQTVEGIKIVDVGGASNGAFSLLGDYVIQGQQVVVGGAFAYTLQKNGVSTPTDGDWYLRSSLINPPPAASAGPLYQPGVPLYENYAQVLLGLNELPTSQQRVGNRYWGGSDAMARAGIVPVPGDGSPTPSAFWGRIEGRRADLQPSNTTGSTYTADQMKLQAGLDGLALENERGRLIVGLTAQYGLTTANVTSFFGNGRIRVEGAGVGATLTWYGDNGFYVDGQAQSMFYHSDLSSVLVGSLTHGNEGLGYAFSAETGRRIAVGNGWSLTPQAQLAYSKVDFDSFADRFGARVSLRDADSLLGRAGVALGHQKTWNDGWGIVRSDVYGIANVHYEFLNGTSVDVAGTSFASAQDRLWGSIGGGGAYSWANGRYAVFGEVSYNASLAGSSDNHSYKGTGGFRIVW